MKLLLKRLHKTEKSTIGELSVDGKYECYILEDIERDVKVHGKTAIPKGTYSIIINRSARFKRDLPLLLSVPGYEGVRIHPGNTSEQTEGCLLPGKTRGQDFVGESRKAFDALFLKMVQAKDPITITIE